MTLLSNLGKPQFTMNIFLHVIILFTIFSALFKLVIIKLTTTLVTNEIDNLMRENISDNANTILQNSGINKILYNLLDSKLNTYMKELTTIQNSLIITNDYIQSVTNINKQVSGIQKLLINSNLMKKPNDDNDNSTLDKIVNFNKQIIKTIQILQRIQSIIRKEPSALDVISIIQVLNQTDIFKQLSEYYSHPDKTSQIINNNIFDKMYTFIIFLVVFFIILIFIFSKNSDFHISHIIIENVITLLLIGIIQVAFFLKIGNKYLPAVQSFSNTKLFATLKQKFSN
jgi:hypothetical protein